MGAFAVFDLLPTTLIRLGGGGVKLLSPPPKLCQKVLKITVTTWALCAFVVESESFKSYGEGRGVVVRPNTYARMVLDVSHNFS